MQAITPALEALLKSRLQAGDSGFRARIEIDVLAGSALACSASLSDAIAATESTYNPTPAGTYDASVTPTADASLILLAGLAYNGNTPSPTAGTWSSPVTTLYDTTLAHLCMSHGYDPDVAAGAYTGTMTWTPGYAIDSVGAVAVAVPTSASTPVQIKTGKTTVQLDDPATAGNLIVVMVGSQGVTSAFGIAVGSPGGTTDSGFVEHGVAVGPNRTSIFVKCADGGEEYFWPDYDPPLANHAVTVMEFAVEGSVTGLVQITPTPSRIDIDRSLQMASDQATVEIPNEGLSLDWGPTSIPTNSRCRAYEWYGDPANEVRVFTGIVDKHLDERDPLKTTLQLQDMFQILIDGKFVASDPQGADEDGAVRTEDNGVYLNREVSYIFNDILDRAGLPTADRSITPTSFVPAEYILADGESWAAQIIGDDRLTGLVGYNAWADELGVIHFDPTFLAGSLTDPGDPAYTFRSGEDITELHDETSQDDLATRVRVRGPLTTETLTDTWREVWRTTKFRYPVGLWYDPTDSANLRVVDRGTKYLYTLRQSDRAVITKAYLGTVIPHPLGLSGDPSDSTIYWVLNCPWIDGGASTGNQVMKVRKSDDHVLATYSLPNGRWSALKVSGSYLWLTNLDTDRFYSRSKADATAVADYSHTYASVVQTNPAGMMIDGTTLSIFWTNGGTTARFLQCEESAPATVTNVVKTAGTVLHGGEMDTTTHTECYGDSDSLGLVAKFTLIDVASQTDVVYAEAVDSDLEDELGSLAQLEDRTHDTHSGDAAHPFEIRRLTLDIDPVLSLAQATQTAITMLEKYGQRRRVLDFGIIGNPALQKTDLIRVEDPVTGIATDFLIDTYRSSMVADGTYLGTLAVLPFTQPDDTPTDSGDAT